MIDKLFIQQLKTKSGGLNPNLMRLHSLELQTQIPSNLKHLPLSEALYWIDNDLLDYPKYCRCGAPIKNGFNFKQGYTANYCCSTCHIRKADKIQKTYKNGIWPTASKEAKEKREKTNMERYGGNPNKFKEVRDKIRNTNLLRYGTVCNLSLVENKGAHMKDKAFQEKMKIKNLEKYGVEHIFQLPNVIEKRCKTNIEKYGTIIPKYAYIKGLDIRKKKEKEKVLTRLKNQNITLLEEYTGVEGYRKYSLQCDKCDQTFLSPITSVLCPYCNKKISSLIEQQMFDFCYTIDKSATQRTRTIIRPKEIDIWMPASQVGIEIHGLRWHSENFGGKDKHYHLNKFKLATQNNIQLLQFFEDEIINKQDIVKSIIRIKTKTASNRIFARNTQLVELNSGEADIFLNQTHLQGTVKSGFYRLGLVCGSKFVAVCVIGKSRYENDNLELLRLSFNLDTVVIGGFSKMLKHLKNRFNGKTLITYADLRFGTGEVYAIHGFHNNGRTSPGYSYVRGLCRFNRQHFQKHKLKEKLKVFDPLLTEWENMKNNGYDRVWDCGHQKYSLTL